MHTEGTGIRQKGMGSRSSTTHKGYGAIFHQLWAVNPKPLNFPQKLNFREPKPLSGLKKDVPTICTHILEQQSFPQNTIRERCRAEEKKVMVGLIDGCDILRFFYIPENQKFSTIV